MEERQKKSQMSRLDYFLISPEFYGFVTEADIDISYRSNHSLITAELNFITQERKGRRDTGNLITHYCMTQNTLKRSSKQ